MDETKPWYASRTVWASAATIAVGVLEAMKIKVDPALAGDLATWAASAATVASGGVALYGRLKATRKIAGAAPPPAPPPPPLRLAGAGLLLAWILTSGGCASADPAFLRAERATYAAIAPEYEQYVAADAGLDAEQKARRHRTVQTWDLSLRRQEQGSQGRTTP